MVEYFQLEELPGREMFRCDRRHATLQVTACAEMWKGANEKHAPDRLDQCRNCQIGAHHAGAGEISTSPLRGMIICARCQRGATRLIKGHLCVSCQNRQYEYLKGKNAKGSAPRMHPPLYHLSVTVLAGDQIKRIEVEHAVSTEELVIAALRDTSKQVSFSFTRPVSPAMQGEMAL